jgi:subtilisin family serine protease
MKFLILHIFTLLYALHLEAKPIKVVVIDTGIKSTVISRANLCETGHLDLTGDGLADISGHGTNVTGLIVANAGDPADYCIVVVKAYKMDSHPIRSWVPQAMIYAAAIHADIVNISGGGVGSDSYEEMATKSLLRTNVTLVVAAGNEETNLNKSCNYFPACYDPRIVVVGATESFSNYGNIVDIKIPGKDHTAFGITMSGTSQATAIITGRIIKNLAINKKVR